MFKTTIDKNATLVYTNSWEYRVYMCRVEDHGLKRQSIGIVIESPDGSLSDIIYVKRSQIFTSKNTFNFLFDCEGDFDKQDIDNVKTEVMHKLNKSQSVDFSSKEPIEQVYLYLCQYVKDCSNDVQVSISDGYCNIDTKAFEGIVKELDFGYKKLEILRLFKLMGLMRINQNRPYDWMLTDKNGTPYRVYSFKCLNKDEINAEGDGEKNANSFL